MTHQTFRIGEVNRGSTNKGNWIFQIDELHLTTNSLELYYQNMVKINVSGNPEARAVLESVKGKVVDSEAEYRKFVQNHPLPDGYEWTRSPFTEEGKWKVSHAKVSETKATNTDLERQLRSLLKEWGFWKHFQHDCRLFGRQIDFADKENQVALEPGAAYWHTESTSEGEIISDIATHPEQVYSPVKQSDLEKQETLVEAGWTILWMSEDAVKKSPEDIRGRLKEIYS